MAAATPRSFGRRTIDTGARPVALSVPLGLTECSAAAAASSLSRLSQRAPCTVHNAEGRDRLMGRRRELQAQPRCSIAS